MKLKAKVEMFNDFVQLAVQENQIQQADTDQLIEELMQENRELRSILKIHRDMHNPDSITDEERQIEASLEHHE